MKFGKSLLLYVFLTLIAIVIGIVTGRRSPIIHDTLDTDNFGSVSLAKPLWGSQGLALIFIDSNKFGVRQLGQDIASTGLANAIVDIQQVFKTFNTNSEQCLDDKSLAAYLSALTKQLSIGSEKPLFIAGIGSGALIPFINSLAPSSDDTTNLSIDFFH